MLQAPGPRTARLTTVRQGMARRPLGLRDRVFSLVFLSSFFLIFTMRPFDGFL